MPALHKGECIRWKRRQSAHNFRVIAFDKECGIYALFDLDQDQDTRTQVMTLVPAVELEPLIGHGVQRLDHDPIRDGIPSDEELEEKYPDRITRRTKRWELVQYLFGRVGKDDKQGEPPFGQDPSLIFLDATWRKHCVCRHAKSQGVKSERIYEVFWACVRGGCDRRALTPRYDRTGSPGQPKSMIPIAEKPGARSSGYYQDPDHYHPQNRVSPFWRGRMFAQIIAKVVSSAARARTAFTNLPALEQEFRSRFCFQPAHPAVVERRKIRSDRIPKPEPIRRHFKSILTVLRKKLETVLPPLESRPPAGKGSDIGIGNELIADMDMTEFTMIRIVVPSDDGKNWRNVGSPRVILGVVRGSDYPLGWYVTIGPEDKDAYCYCLVNMFTDKLPQLRALGFEKGLEGLISANVDRVVGDGGALSGKQHTMFMLKNLFVDFSKVRPGHPRGKGNVEGANMRAKKGVYGRFRSTREVYENLLQRTQAADRRHPSARKYPNVKDSIRKGGPIIYMEIDDFERVLVSVLSEEALKWRDAPNLQTQDAFVKDRRSTRLQAFLDQQGDRRGDRAVHWTEQEIRHAIFERRLKRESVKDGQIAIGDLKFGVEAKGVPLNQDVQTLVDWERDARRDGSKAIFVHAAVDSSLEISLCLLPDGRWLELPATRATRAKLGARARHAVWRMLHRYWLDKGDKERMKKDDAVSSPTAKKKDMSSAQRKERENIKRAASVHGGKARFPRNSAATTALDNQRATQSRRDADAAGAPAKKAIPSRRPPPGYAPRSRLGSGTTVVLTRNSEGNPEPSTDGQS